MADTGPVLPCAGMAVDLHAIVASIARARARGDDVVLLSRAMTCPRWGSDALTAPSKVVVDSKHFGARACRRCSHSFLLVIVPSAGIAGALVDAANLAPRPPTATANVAPRRPTALPPAPSIAVDEQDDELDDDGRAANVSDPENIDDAAQVLQGWRVRLAVARSRNGTRTASTRSNPTSHYCARLWRWARPRCRTRDGRGSRCRQVAAQPRTRRLGVRPPSAGRLRERDDAIGENRAAVAARSAAARDIRRCQAASQLRC